MPSPEGPEPPAEATEQPAGPQAFENQKFDQQFNEAANGSAAAPTENSPAPAPAEDAGVLPRPALTPPPPPAPKRLGLFLPLGMLIVSMVVVILLLILVFILGLIIGKQMVTPDTKTASLSSSFSARAAPRGR